MRDGFGTTTFGDAQDGERRNELRRKQIRGAKIVYNNGHSLLDCAVRDLSEAGARLRIEMLIELPDTFSLLFQDGRKRPAEVIWRKSQSLGVRFLDMRESGSDIPARGGEAALLDRITKIEKGLAELRAELMVLVRR